MTYRWASLAKKWPDVPAIVECCHRTLPPSEVIFVALTPKQQKQLNQPPFRYRCTTCGPTQEPFPMPKDAA